METGEQREKYKNDGRRYPGDPTDVEWETIRPLFSGSDTLRVDLRDAWRQFRHGDVALRLHPADQDLGMRCQLATAGRAPLPGWVQRAGCRHPLGKPHARACAHIEPARRRTT